ncbi:uncharacterized protein TNCV_859851 [Trichonephila clavipes]|nr:uncharacterized protein TNCV_859851 [Trichonephila clavipes]
MGVVIHKQKFSTHGAPKQTYMLFHTDILIEVACHRYTLNMQVSAVPDYCQLTGTLPPLLDSVVGEGTPGRSFITRIYGSNAAVPGNLCGAPKSVRKLRSGDLLIETASAVQSKSFLMAKTFLDSTLTVTPHKSSNCSRGVISESDLLCASEAEILEGLSDPDENITKIVCLPLKLLSPLISDPKPTISFSVPAVNKSSTSTQAELVPSTSSVLVASPSKSQPPNSVIDTVPTASNSLSLLHLLHPQHALFLKGPPLYPIPYQLHPRVQIKPQSPVERNVPLKTNPTL